MHRLISLLKTDPRYPLEAYEFVQEALSYAQDVLEMGETPADVESEEVDRHLTGQQLCEAIRQYALKQYGYMAIIVFQDWGITSTSDFGEIVYNLIGIGAMKKSKHDRREDFDDVYDFDEAFRRNFEISPPD